MLETRTPADVTARLSTVSFSALNGWRGPGAILIALGHLTIFIDLPGTRHIESVAVVVDLFFVLSGMMIAHAYGAKLVERSAVLPYVIRRFGRIWPLHAVLLGVLIAYELAKLAMETFGGVQFSSPPFSPNGGALVSAIPTNLLLVQALGLHDRETWNYPSWSLSVEFATYVVFALYCLAGPVWRRRLSFATIALSLVILAFAPYGMRSTYDFGFFRCLVGFFAGVLTYELVAARSLPRWPLPTLVEIGALVATGLWAVWAKGSHVELATPLMFCGFVLVFVAERGAISRLLRTRSMQVWAEWSYSIYIVHAVVLMCLLGGLRLLGRLLHTELLVPRLFTSADPALGSFFVETLRVDHIGLKILILAAYAMAVMGIAYVAHRFIEAPARERFNRFAGALSRRRNARAAAAVAPPPSWGLAATPRGQFVIGQAYEASYRPSCGDAALLPPLQDDAGDHHQSRACWREPKFGGDRKLA